MHEPQRRRFSRVDFHAGGQLAVNGQVIACEIEDLSMKGALVTVARDAPELVPDCPVQLGLTLGDDGEHIIMQTHVAHIHDQQYGLHCTEIDLDSVTALRRLVELNLGDPALLERDLSALIAEAGIQSAKR